MNILKDPATGLMLPSKFIDEKIALKNVLDELVEKSINSLRHIKETYFLTIHAKFDPFNRDEFKITEPKATFKLPPFVSNSFVFWVCPKRGICELLWMVPPKKRAKDKLRVEFNKKGVAYLQVKGAMPRA